MNPIVYWLGGLLVPSAVAIYLAFLRARTEAKLETLRAEYESEKESLKERAAARKDLLDRVAELERTNAEIRAQLAQAQPFYAAMLTKMIATLTHPSKEFHTADALLAKVTSDSLTVKEQKQLDDILVERATDPNPKVTEEERLVAAILPTVIVLAEAEKNSPEPVTSVITVAVKQEVKVKDNE